MTTRVYLWDNLKFIAMMCIVLFHSTIPYRIDGCLILKYIHPIINYYSMTLFALISGYWYKDKSFKEMALIYLWPCLLFSIVNHIWGSNTYYPIYYHNSNYWANFSFRVGPAMWYLMALFLYAVATKWMRKYLGTTGCLVFAFVIAVAIGFLPIPNCYFDIQRISCLFPVFIFGFWMREKLENQMYAMKLRRGKRMLFAAILFLCILYNLYIIHYKPSMSGGFATYYGPNLRLALAKWIMMIVRVIACVCIIIIVPNKEYWFTKYGSRTMNVYLLHDTLILLICWGCLYNYRYEWYGLLSLFLGVPLLCSLLFSTPVDKFMRKILLSDYLKSIKKSHQ